MSQEKLSEIRSRPATVRLSTRCDARYLATLVLFYKNQNSIPKSTSELVRLVLESFAQLLVHTGKVDFVQNHRDALEILERSSLNPESINPQNLAKALVAEGISTDDIPSFQIDSSHRRTKASSKISHDNPIFKAAHDALEDHLSNIGDKNEEFKKKEEANLAKFKEGMLPPEILKPNKDKEGKEDE